RIALLGAAGIGKTTLARALLHCAVIHQKYAANDRYFVACDAISTIGELTSLIATHLGINARAQNIDRLIFNFFRRAKDAALIVLDNLETVWEPENSRSDVEEFLAVLSSFEHLALIVTIRGTERPAGIKWTRPFVAPLQPLSDAAARQTFLDIADDQHNDDEVEKVLRLTDNMPLAISLMAHLAEAEGCTAILTRWENERTSMLSEGVNRKSNLDISISVSFSSGRLKDVPGSLELLSLLSLLPDGLSDAFLLETKLPFANVLSCKVALLRTSLAYNDHSIPKSNQSRLKMLTPIREYVRKYHPPSISLVQPVLEHY
ncbi:hypothetical protein C8F01DRAFT_929264, partial [Mycena amicta]